MPAGGSGTRLRAAVAHAAAGADLPATKALLNPDSSQTFLERIVRTALHTGLFRCVVIAAPGEALVQCRAVLEPICRDIDLRIVRGGATRQDSVRNALESVGDGCAYVHVHDGARPLCPPEIFERVLEAAMDTGAAVPTLPLKFSVKQSDDGVRVAKTVARSSLFEVQTPQCFALPLLRDAHQRAHEAGHTGTDDSELVERLGAPVRIVAGSEENIKITTPLDILLYGAILQARARE